MGGTTFSSNHILLIETSSPNMVEATATVEREDEAQRAHVGT